MSNEEAAQVQVEVQVHVEMDYAPESFWLSKDAEIDWLDRNAFMERKDSGKATTAHSSSTNNFNPSVGSNRYSASKSKPSIIGLPNYGGGEPKNRKQRHCKPPSIRLFPKRTESKSGRMSEPSSPKVSCMGRVRSKKERNRSRKAKNNHRKVTGAGGGGGGGGVLVRNKSMNNNKERKSKGFWNNFRSIFKPKTNTNTNTNCCHDDDDEDKKGMKKRGFDSSSVESPNPPCSGEAPGLGGVKRFASGRR